MKFETGIPLGNIVATSDAIIAAFGVEHSDFSSEGLFSHACAAERYLYDLGMPLEICAGSVATIISGDSPTENSAAIGCKAVLFRDEHEWQLIHLGPVIRYPGSDNELQIKLTRQQKTWLRQQTALAA
jgi:hypothetical protein